MNWPKKVKPARIPALSGFSFGRAGITLARFFIAVSVGLCAGRLGNIRPMGDVGLASADWKAAPRGAPPDARSSLDDRRRAMGGESSAYAAGSRSRSRCSSLCLARENLRGVQQRRPHGTECQKTSTRHTAAVCFALVITSAHDIPHSAKNALRPRVGLVVIVGIRDMPNLMQPRGNVYGRSPPRASQAST